MYLLEVIALLIAALGPVAAAAAASYDRSDSAYRLHEKRERAHPAWVAVGRANPEASVPVRISLRQSNVEEGMRAFDDMTDFSSSNYGKWWTPEQISDFFAPSQGDTENVRAWLIDAGVDASRISQSFNKQWLQFDAPIAELESLLNTTYYEYQHRDGRVTPACDQYHVPAHLDQVIDYIKPGINLGRSLSRQAQDTSRQLASPSPRGSDDAKGCDVFVTPDCIFAIYNITKGCTAFPGNDLGLFQAPIFPYSQEDLNLFFKNLYPTIPFGTRPKEDDIDGAPNSNKPASQVTNPEANLDAQVSYPVIWPQNIIQFETGDAYYSANADNFSQYSFWDAFLDAIDGSFCNKTSFDVGPNVPGDQPYPDNNPGGYMHPQQCGVFKAPHVLSTSYDDVELDNSVSYSRRQCLEWMKLGMQGTSVIDASGDNGVGCDANDDRIFNPTLIASCPYVTAVGGTTIPAGESVHAPQIATTAFASGGGFSNIYPQPAYQQKMVQQYLKRNPPPFKSYSTLYNQSVGHDGGVYNRIGRAYPDLAATAQFIVGYSRGRQVVVNGTSAAAPLFAAMLTRINEVRLQQGKSTVGFVNPVLYRYPELLLNDVTVGSNPNNSSIPPCDILSPGFVAAPGWDPVTGLGTPNYRAMLDFWIA